MRRHAPFEPIDPNICMWGGVADVINLIAFPIEIVHRPYNSVGTTVPHCDQLHPRSQRRRCAPMHVSVLSKHMPQIAYTRDTTSNACQIESYNELLIQAHHY